MTSAGTWSFFYGQARVRVEYCISQSQPMKMIALRVGGEYSHLGSSLLGCAGCVSAGGNISVLTNEKRPRLLGICRLLPPTV